MATISAVSSISSNFIANSWNMSSVAASPVRPRVGFGAIGNSCTSLRVVADRNRRFPFPRLRKGRALAGGGEENAEALNSQDDGEAVESVDEQLQEAAAAPASATTTTTDQTISVPVSPSDLLTMFFQAEGTMNEIDIPKVTDALGQTEGVTDLKVQVLEGIASVELKKQTTVQATGVASGLVEIIQGSGFKLQTLNLSFQDEEDKM